MHRTTSITVREDEAVTTVRLAGEIDVTTREQGRRAIAAAATGGRPVVIDLAEVRFIDSSGVAFLLQCYRTCTGAGLDCRLRAVPRQAQVVLDLLGLQDVLPVEPDRAAAGR